MAGRADAVESARAPHIWATALPRAAVQARVRGGVPLLHEQPLTLDLQFAADLFTRLAQSWLAREQPDSLVAERLHRLLEVVQDGGLDWHTLVTEAFVQHAEHVAEIAARAVVDAELLVELARAAVAPLLAGYARRLEPLLNAAEDDASGAVWRRGYCPICGSWPAAAEPAAQGQADVLRLRCGACGCAWRAPQDGACPFCQTARAFGHADQPAVYACAQCGRSLPLLAASDLPAPPFNQPAGAGFVIELGLPEDDWSEEVES